ncbi:MAG: carbamoyltransferase HypF [Verrucomicrobiota bacterium]
MTTLEAKTNLTAKRLKLAIRGAVQGVGFRPFVYRLADSLGLTGWVNNSPQGVFIEVEGAQTDLENFLVRLEAEKPAHSSIQSCQSSWLDAVGYERFEIRASECSGAKTALVLPDIATCPDCIREIFDPANRRHHYPFTNCTHCGPRFSIMHALPYDRANTTMARFAMCPACQSEYDNPNDRRFHAQPNACPVCGPKLELWATTSNHSAGIEREESPPRLAEGQAALRAAAAAIRLGQIVAVKGIGGFHLVVDARNEAAVRRLRERKHREEKPFALMFPTLASVQTACDVSPLEEWQLRSPEAPIVLLRRTTNSKSPIASLVAPSNPNLAVMLPSNPLHHLLLAELGFPVVATSGNLSDEPICTDELDARKRLSGIADVLLVHNRPIVRQVDDSIVRVILDREMVLRRARGYAPLPIATRTEISPSATTLAVGAHLKNTVALAIGQQVFLSQHLGDLETEPANLAFRQAVQDLPQLYDVEPQVIAADLHPDYLSTRFAEEVCLKRTLSPVVSRKPKLLQVQHHEAHVLACLAENEVALPAIGVAWDGTGYGADGTIWGGEFFLVTDDAVERVAHLRPFRLPGGDAAVKEPRRAALGLLYEQFGGACFERADLPTVAAFSKRERTALRAMLSRGVNSPWCSSMGRLFDAVASLTGLRQQMRFEGQAAMELESALDAVDTEPAYELALLEDGPCVLDWSALLENILTDVAHGVSPAAISARFHNALSNTIVQVARHFDCPRVALSGGCFQNRYLTERSVMRLRNEGFQPYWHQRVPTNDGGIALGQVAAARRAQPVSLFNQHTSP